MPGRIVDASRIAVSFRNSPPAQTLTTRIKEKQSNNEMYYRRSAVLPANSVDSALTARELVAYKQTSIFLKKGILVIKTDLEIA